MEKIHLNNTGPTRASYIDIFRGIAIALMIIVNNQGDWGNVFRIFRHASWHGFLGADIVFPLFLFIMGASMPLSINTQIANGISRGALAVNIIRRAAIFIAIGIVINLLPRFDIATMRIPGVLQRIGLCYGAAGLIYLFMTPRSQYIFAATILTLYTAALLFIGPDGFGLHPLTPDGTICYMLDRALFAGHTYAHAPIEGFDPEGLLSTLPAIVSTMVGFFVSDVRVKRAGGNTDRTDAVLLGAAAASMIAGIIIAPVLPINKNLWTPSYVLLTSGISIFIITILKIIEDRGQTGLWFLPFRWLGTNSLFIYIASTAAGKILATTPVSSQDGGMTIKAIIYSMLFTPWLAPHSASFAYAFAFLIVWMICAGVLYRKGIVVKV